MVRPKAAPCLGSARSPAKLLVARAADALERGDASRALACADEAIRAAPRSVAALDVRGAALAALGREDDARVAYARALALDPDDAQTLRDAAELYIHHLGADRGSLELGLEYALRGIRVASQRPDRGALAAQLALFAATAENDLGESGAALRHAELALVGMPDDVDALYEKGVALYELCRFAPAAEALSRALAQEPDDAWALHQLALVAERTGDVARAEGLERRAHALAPDDFPSAIDMDATAFEREVRRAVAALPPADRRALRDVPVEVADVPALEDLTAVDPPLSPSILGLFRGPPELEACGPDDGPHCRSIVFYRRNLARFARSRQELEEQVRVTLLHELGHLRGESDDDLRARGLE